MEIPSNPNLSLRELFKIAAFFGKTEIVTNITSPRVKKGPLELQQDLAPTEPQVLIPEEKIPSWPTKKIHPPYGFQNEASIAVNPENPDIITVSMNYSVRLDESINTPVFDPVVFRSDNGGRTWERVVLPDYPKLSCNDTSLAYSADGRLFYSALTSDYIGIVRNISISHSDDGGKDWSRRKILDTSPDMQRPLDRPLVTSDRYTEGFVLATWNKSGVPYYSRSLDNGERWDSPVAAVGINNVSVTSPLAYRGKVFLASLDRPHSATDVIVHRQRSDNTFALDKVATYPKYIHRSHPVWAVERGFNLVLVFGDDQHLYWSSAHPELGNWSQPSLLAYADEGDQWVNPMVTTDPYDRVVVGAYLFRQEGSLQLYMGQLRGTKLVPIGPRMTVVGGDDWYNPDDKVYRQYCGDYNTMVSNGNNLLPGVVAAFTTAEAGKSFPPVFVYDSDNNIESGEVTTAYLENPNNIFVPLILLGLSHISSELH